MSQRIQRLLKNGGFQAFLWTQFLGAFNDNVYKIIVSMRAVHVAASTGGGSAYLSLAGVVFVAAVPAVLRLCRTSRRRRQQTHGADRGEGLRDLRHAVRPGGFLHDAH